MRGIINPGSFYKMEDLIDKMKYYGIEKALVYHALAKEYSPAAGNAKLMEEISGHPSLIPVWAVMPHHTGEFPEPAVLADMLKKNRVKAVRLFPGVWNQNFSLAAWNSGKLLSMLQENRVPVMMDLEQTDWNGIFDLCSEYPKLNIILTESDYRIDRNIYPLFERFDNLYMEILGYKVSGGIEEICKRFGAKRLIFGSGMPVFSGAGAMSMGIFAGYFNKGVIVVYVDRADNLSRKLGRTGDTLNNVLGLYFVVSSYIYEEPYHFALILIGCFIKLRNRYHLVAFLFCIHLKKCSSSVQCGYEAFLLTILRVDFVNCLFDIFSIF